MKLVRGTPTAALLDLSLLLGPLAYLLLDAAYVVRGWWDADVGAAHLLVAALYGLTALRLVTLARGRIQAALLVVAALGVVGNAGVGVDTLHVGLGGTDLFDLGGPANLFKTLGFLFPLTLLVAAVALRGRVPSATVVALGAGAVLFPVAHVGNVSWLAILDAVVLVGALGHVFALRHLLDPVTEPAEPAPSASL